ncbi:MAG: hypothetical protein QOG73_4781 [Acetobacteraceae bacterium]|nr:hypothetical protein [Acetobacteraceae bacterium]
MLLHGTWRQGVRGKSAAVCSAVRAAQTGSGSLRTINKPISYVVSHREPFSDHADDAADYRGRGRQLLRPVDHGMTTVPIAWYFRVLDR